MGAFASAARNPISSHISLPEMALNTVIYYAALRGIDYLSEAVEAAAPAQTETKPSAAPVKEAPAAKKAEEEVDEDDLFGGVDEEELAAEKKRREDEKKHKKKVEEIQRSNIIFDVKPLGDDTDLNEMEKVVRAITLDGLTWGPSKFVDIAYGVKKLQISCVVVDDKVFTEDIEEGIMAHEELVQSVDIASFTKV